VARWESRRASRGWREILGWREISGWREIRTSRIWLTNVCEQGGHDQAPAIGNPPQPHVTHPENHLA